jgi:very-short-patch-repair endonuclease
LLVLRAVEEDDSKDKNVYRDRKGRIIKGSKLPDEWLQKRHERPGNSLGKKRSEEQRKRISEGHKGIPSPFKGVKLTGERRDLSSKQMIELNRSKKGIPKSEDHKRKISEALKGERHYMFGKHPSEEHRRKVGDGVRGERNGNFGRNFSVEHRRKIGLAGIGRKHTEDWKRKASESMRGSKNQFYGRKHSAATRARIRALRALQRLPIKDTDIERAMQGALRKAGIIFETHKLFRVLDTIHAVDIFIPPSLVVECDGDYFHGRLDKIRRDFVIDAELEKRGIRVLRFWETDIENNLSWCLRKIKERLK